MKTIFSCRRQAVKVRAVTGLMALWCAGFALLAVQTGRTLGLAPGDGGVLRPAGHRWSVAAVFGLIGVAPLAGMVIYSSRYVTRVERGDGKVRLTVIGMIRPKEESFPLTEVESAAGYEGRLTSRRGLSVDAPWITLRVSGRRYVLDQQAEHCDVRAVRRLVTDAGVEERGRATSRRVREDDRSGG